MIRTLLKPFSFLPALFLMYLIYSFSAQTGDVSAELSYKVSYKIVETADYVFETDMDYWEIDYWATTIHGATRKLAHMAIYFTLAVSVAFPLYVYGVRGIWLMLLAGIICVGFACGDEYHQSFVEGRGPSKRDVAIDTFGVFWGIILVRIVGWTGRKTIFRPRKIKKKISPSKTITNEMPPQWANTSPYANSNPYMNNNLYGNHVPYENNDPYRNHVPYKNTDPYRNQAPYANNDPDSYQPYKDAIHPPYQNH